MWILLIEIAIYKVIYNLQFLKINILFCILGNWIWWFVKLLTYNYDLDNSLRKKIRLCFSILRLFKYLFCGHSKLYLLFNSLEKNIFVLPKWTKNKKVQNFCSSGSYDVCDMFKDALTHNEHFITCRIHCLSQSHNVKIYGIHAISAWINFQLGWDLSARVQVPSKLEI